LGKSKLCGKQLAVSFKKMADMRDFRKLKVWEKAHHFTLRVYRITKNFPSDERFGLTVQLRRAVASIPTNIAEGCGRGSELELARFMSIAAGSASEVEYQLLLACDLNYIQDETHRELNQQVNEIKRMLNSFIQQLTANG
jgi:four helix bundle protein